MASPATPPPPPLPTTTTTPPTVAKKGFLRRIVPLFLAANIAVGVYVLARTYKDEPGEKDEEAPVKITSSPATSTEAPVHQKTMSAEPARAPPSISEGEQRQLFKWILEEKRKVKPRDALEKKKIDEEKALLKQFIRAESIPKF